MKEMERYYSYPLLTVKEVGELYKVCEVRRPMEEPEKKRKDHPGEQRFESSVARARTAVKELAMCNPWEWFVTLTLDDSKQDRYDLNAYHKKLTRFVSDQNKRRPPEAKIAYIMIPERHKDGAWHMHGLIHGLLEDDLYRNKYGYWGWKSYEKSFGFLSVGRIKSRQAVIGYVCKYICKNLAREIEKTSAHMYYRSRGLQEPVRLFSGQGEYEGAWGFKNPAIGLKLAYTDTLDEVVMVDNFGMAAKVSVNTAAIVADLDLYSDTIGEVLDGYAPLTMAGWSE